MIESNLLRKANSCARTALASTSTLTVMQLGKELVARQVLAQEVKPNPMAAGKDSVCNRAGPSTNCTHKQVIVLSYALPLQLWVHAFGLKKAGFG
jgi:hypothetical protein